MHHRQPDRVVEGLAVEGGALLISENRGLGDPLRVDPQLGAADRRPEAWDEPGPSAGRIPSAGWVSGVA